MKICFDLRALQIGHENRGIGMFIKSVLEHLPANSHDYIVYAFDKNDPIKALDAKVNFSYKLVQTPTIKTALNSPKDIFGLLKLVFHSFKSLKRERPDIFVQFDFTLGIPNWRKTKTVVTGYDLIPLIKKNEYMPSVTYAFSHTPTRGSLIIHIMRSVRFRIKHLSFKFKRPRVITPRLRATIRAFYYRLRYRLHYKVFKKADSIITISKITADSFHKLLGIDKKKIHAIHLAPVLSSQDQQDKFRKKVNKPYILYVGGTDSRKRIQDIIYAFNIARSRGDYLELVLAGNEFSRLEHVPNIEGRNAIINSPYKSDIKLVGFVNDAQKRYLYHNAHAFIFCTAYEGFGLPIVEAMQCGCPVISYNNSSVPEAAGDAALLVETGNFVAIAKSILALKDQSLRKSLIQKGLKQSQKFNWHNTSKEIMDVITFS